MTNVELKHMATTEDMGGEVLPDQRLEQENQDNYAVVAAGSQQDINQRLSTGVPGSKEQGKLETRPARSARAALRERHLDLRRRVDRSPGSTGRPRYRRLASCAEAVKAPLTLWA